MVDSVINISIVLDLVSIGRGECRHCPMSRSALTSVKYSAVVVPNRISRTTRCLDLDCLAAHGRRFHLSLTLSSFQTRFIAIVLDVERFRLRPARPNGGGRQSRPTD